jgi:hypothetical protein
MILAGFRWLALSLVLLLPACGSPSPGVDGGGTDAGSDADATGVCALTANTTATTTSLSSGCFVVDRDTSSCRATRQAAGLDGAWLKFSCRVTLTASGTDVQIATDSRPDHISNYFATGDACYQPYTTAFPDPNHIGVQSIVITVPRTPTTTSQTMGLGPVGIAVDAVAIYDNQAAPGDDIFLEAQSFDRCGGHPDMRSVYHYHGEPYAISNDDNRLIGILRDGYFVYGRRDADGSLPTLDTHGGHVGTTPDSTTPVYHYHLNQQTSTASGTAGQMQWFLTTGTYEGSPGTCTGC